MKKSELIVVNGGYIGNDRPVTYEKPEKLLPPGVDMEIQEKLTNRQMDLQMDKTIEMLLPPGVELCDGC
ncbi:MAG: hypothetical protein D4R64_04250 [Porphyromonadaceae bacterium]|nr:MAG: hypothetical protein D4R64_04250 [Porphyromonadaceae bacterium]